MKVLAVVATLLVAAHAAQVAVVVKNIISSNDAGPILAAKGYNYPFAGLFNNKRQAVESQNAAGPTGVSDVTNYEDWSVLLQPTTASDGKGFKKLYAITQHETAPTPSFLLALKQNVSTGEISYTDVTPIDQSAFGGEWIGCGGSRPYPSTRWGSEEYEPDARAYFKAIATGLTATVEGAVKAQARFFGIYNNNLTVDNLNAVGLTPYLYGWTTSTRIDPNGKVVDYRKLYTFGRFAHELSVLMPDGKTVYSTDDGTNCAFYKFVADVKDNFNSGKLYAARFTQTSASPPAFTLTWILLSSGTQSVIRNFVRSLKFDDIFDSVDADCTANSVLPSVCTCPDSSYRTVNAGHAAKPVECLRVKEGMQTAAAFLETRRYAGYMGATTELSKWEGMALYPQAKKLFLAVSEIREGMEDNRRRGSAGIDTRHDKGTNNDIRLPYNPCGMVLELALDSKWSATTAESIVTGSWSKADPANACDVNSIAAPDNLAWIQTGVRNAKLMIYEDTADHQHDVLWEFDYLTKSLTRVATGVYGNEWTSARFYHNINGWNYLTAVSQHPYTESDQSKLATRPAESAGLDSGFYLLSWKASSTFNKKWNFANITTPVEAANEGYYNRFTTSIIVQ